MSSHFKFGAIAAVAVVICYKLLGALFASGPISSEIPQEINIYDIGFSKEESEQMLPDIQLVRHFNDEKKGTESFSTSSLKGKPVVLHFWGTNCRPCMEEMPHFNAFMKKHPEIANLVMTIVPSKQESIDQVRKSLNRFGGTDLDIIVDEKIALARFFEIRAIPTTIFVHANGKVAGQILGPVDWQDERVEALLLEILKEGMATSTPEITTQPVEVQLAEPKQVAELPTMPENTLPAQEQQPQQTAQ